MATCITIKRFGSDSAGALCANCNMVIGKAFFILGHLEDGRLGVVIESDRSRWHQCSKEKEPRPLPLSFGSEEEASSYLSRCEADGTVVEFHPLPPPKEACH